MEYQQACAAVLKHTPGPWRVSQNSNILANGQREFPKMVAAVYITNDTSPSYKDREERDANSRLIAAAPELLAALMDAMPFIRALQADTELSDRADALIASVRGE